MKIDSAKQLDNILKTLRKHGVTHYKTGEIDVTLTLLPAKQVSSSLLEEIFPEARMKVPAYNGENVTADYSHTPTFSSGALSGEVAPPEAVKTPDALTEEELLDWSVRSEPGTEDSAN
jgi:hypothetical protein